MFRGSAPAKIDAKGRLRVPSDFRRTLNDHFGPETFITSVQGDAALVYPLSEWEELERRLLRLPATDRLRQRYLERVSFFGQQGQLDAQGRVLVPPMLRERAGIDGEVIVCGSLNHLQVWDRDRFVNRLEEQPFTDEDQDLLSDRGI